MKRTPLFAAAIVLIASAALAFRLPRLGDRPMHQDEAIHAARFSTLMAEHRFDYDPRDYHGPTLYYLTAPVAWCEGRDGIPPGREAPYRCVPVAAGVALIVLMLLPARGLGRAESALAAVLVAISPAFVFFSRYYVQEMLLVLFTFGVIATGYRWLRTRRLAWAVACGACVGLMHATKETCVIAWCCMLLALVVTWLLTRSTRGRPRARLLPLLLFLFSAMLVSVACFSVLFTDFANVPKSISAWWHYAHRAGGAGLHAQPWHHYLRMLCFWHEAPGPIWSEALIVALAVVGLVRAVAIRRRRPLWLFIAAWTVAMAAAYSAIPYKTPWTMLGMLHGLILLAGLGAAALVTAPRRLPFRLAVSIVLIAAAAQLGYQAWRTSYRYAWDPRSPYVYAQALPDVRRLADEARRYAADSAGTIRVYAADGDYWPLPFYLAGGSARVGYWDHVPGSPDGDVLIVSPALVAELRAKMGGLYAPVGEFEIRPTVRLQLYVDARLQPEQPADE